MEESQIPEIRRHLLGEEIRLEMELRRVRERIWDIGRGDDSLPENFLDQIPPEIPQMISEIGLGGIPHHIVSKFLRGILSYGEMLPILGERDSLRILVWAEVQWFIIPSPESLESLREWRWAEGESYWEKPIPSGQGFIPLKTVLDVLAGVWENPEGWGEVG